MHTVKDLENPDSALFLIRFWSLARDSWLLMETMKAIAALLQMQRLVPIQKLALDQELPLPIRETFRALAKEILDRKATTEPLRLRSQRV